MRVFQSYHLKLCIFDELLPNSVPREVTSKVIILGTDDSIFDRWFQLSINDTSYYTRHRRSIYPNIATAPQQIGLHLVCSNVSRSSNSITRDLLWKRFEWLSWYSASKPRSSNFFATVFRLRLKVRAALRRDPALEKWRFKSRFFFLFFCRNQRLKVAFEQVDLQPMQRNRWTHLESPVR